ncbi:hypothetical protein TEA_026431 [Camellia sinensis var. sinensis]|uniref:RING-type E3 ubiquitin transferase n=1 Tax=Camellia sinensis var. sinensis TaxID=542762 RepID=A0A4S4DRP8_CAMSN|nr:hypothetical protein TEA_026431 [Camellia sinensis var. sinensis]
MAAAREKDEECIPTSYSKHDSPEIRFPFWLKGYHPIHCGYPGFDLSCTPHSKYPVLELPNFVNVFVNNIDYKSQTVHISELDGCFPLRLPNLNLSASPFRFLTYFPSSDHDFSFINCSQPLQNSFDVYWNVACRSDHSHQVYVMYTIFSPKLSCTKMYNISLPAEICNDYNRFDIIGLEWIKSICGNCEA